MISQKMSLSLILAGGLGVACGQAPAKCDEAACKSICQKSGGGAAAKPAAAKPSGGGALTSFEQGLVDPILADVRSGIRPWAEQSVGICKGVSKECEEWVGTDALDLPEGEYMLRAELRVPKSGDKGTWKVKLETTCETVRTTDKGESKSSSSNSKEYEVRYVGEDHGYRLSPLYKIKSPHKGGARTCNWKLVMKHPDGDKSVEGKWSIPAAE